MVDKSSEISVELQEGYESRYDIKPKTIRSIEA